jgi:hypothetical protein
MGHVWKRRDPQADSTVSMPIERQQGISKQEDRCPQMCCEDDSPSSNKMMGILKMHNAVNGPSATKTMGILKTCDAVNSLSSNKMMGILKRFNAVDGPSLTRQQPRWLKKAISVVGPDQFCQLSLTLFLSSESGWLDLISSPQLSSCSLLV